MHASFSSAQRQPQTPRQYQHVPPQRSLSDRWSYNRQLAMHTPKVLDAEGRLLNDARPDATEFHGNGRANGLGELWANGAANHIGSSAPTSSTSTTDGLPNSQGLYLRSQRLQSHLQTLERATVTPFNGGASSSFTAFPSGSPWNSAFVPEPAESVPQRSLSGYGVANVAPRSVLRQPSSTMRTANSTDGAGAFPSIKSNSLPRRQPGRTIKWRNDLLASGGDNTTPASNPTPASFYSDMSDSDGAVSAPEFPMSPTGRGVPQPVYPLPSMWPGF